MSSGSLKKAEMKKKADGRKRIENQSDKVRLADQRLHECGRKIKYRLIGDAKRAAASLQLKECRPIEVYKCDWCDGFHVGKSPAVAVDTHNQPHAPSATGDE